MYVCMHRGVYVYDIMTLRSDESFQDHSASVHRTVLELSATPHQADQSRIRQKVYPRVDHVGPTAAAAAAS
jgi:hypothetical protein